MMLDQEIGEAYERWMGQPQWGRYRLLTGKDRYHGAVSREFVPDDLLEECSSDLEVRLAYESWARERPLPRITLPHIAQWEMNAEIRDSYGEWMATAPSPECGAILDMFAAAEQRHEAELEKCERLQSATEALLNRRSKRMLDAIRGF